MATNFPTSIDSFTNPISTDLENSVSVPHATQHANANDAITALENRVGITASAVSSSLTKRIAVLEALAGVQGAWPSWTPIIAQGANTPTFTSNNSRYFKFGRFIIAKWSFVLSAAGAAGVMTIFTPFASAATFSAYDAVGTFSGLDISAGQFYSGAAIWVSTSAFRMITSDNSGQNDLVGVFPAWTLASGDTLSGTVMFESAS